MIVSRVNIINTYNKRVLPFKGDTLNNKNPNETLQNKNKLDKPTKFLIGSLTGSAAILGLVLAGKHGLLGSSIKNLFKCAESAAETVSKNINKSEGAADKVIDEIKPLNAKVISVEKKPLIDSDYVLTNPFEKEIINDDEFLNLIQTKGRSYVAGFLTNKENEIVKLPGLNQVEAFSNYLQYAIKNLTPQEARTLILFRPGKYAIDKNITIAEKAIEIAKKNPDHAPAIVNNLLSYETPLDFSSELAKHHFGRPEHLALQIDKHMENLIIIRKLLRKAGLPCDELSRLKARQDWLNINYHTPNTYLLAFQNAPDMMKFKRQAFWYDMSLGIDRKTADEIIERISGGDVHDKAMHFDHVAFEKQQNKLKKMNYMEGPIDRRLLEDKSFLTEIRPPLPIEKDLGLSLETIIKKINKSVVAG